MVEQKIVIKNPIGKKFTRADVNISDDGSVIEISGILENTQFFIPQMCTHQGPYLDETFPIVKASELSINDAFLKYQPYYLDYRPNLLKSILFSELNTGNAFANFRCPIIAPSYDENGHITFTQEAPPAYGTSLNEWVEEAKNFMITKNSRIGTRKNFYSLLGVFIKTLVDDYKFELRNAWDIACNTKYADGIDLLNGCDPNIIRLWYAISGYKKIIRRTHSYNFDILNNTSTWDLPTSNLISNIYQKQDTALGWIICDE